MAKPPVEYFTRLPKKLERALLALSPGAFKVGVWMVSACQGRRDEIETEPLPITLRDFVNGTKDAWGRDMPGTGMSRRSVIRALAELVEAGLIQKGCEEGSGHSQIPAYRIALYPGESSPKTGAKSAPVASKTGAKSTPVAPQTGAKYAPVLNSLLIVEEEVKEEETVASPPSVDRNGRVSALKPLFPIAELEGEDSPERAAQRALDEQAEILRVKLVKGLEEARCLTRRPSPTWRKEFLGLLEFQDFEKVEKVLNWYVENIGGDYIPRAFSAKSFREGFAKIHLAMGNAQRAAASEPAEDKYAAMAKRLVAEQERKKAEV